MKKTLGQGIRELRQGKDLSLRDLGDRLKDPGSDSPVSAAYLSDLENGRRFPSEEMIGKLAAALGTTEQDLRDHDQRAASRGLDELVDMNPQFGFAFRRALEVVTETNMTPDEFVRRVTTASETQTHVQVPQKSRTVP